MSEEISDSEKNSKNLFRVPLKQNRRLLSTISVQKSIENERKILLIIYLQQEKFPKIIPSHWSKFEDYFRLLQSRNWSKTCGRYFWYYISIRKNFQKLFQAIEANSKTTFDYFSPEIDRKRTEEIPDDIFATEKNSKNYSKPSKRIRRLLSTISVQKLIKNAWKVFLMIYQSRKNSNKLFRVIWSI